MCWNGESGEKCKFIVSLTGAADQSADGILAVAIHVCMTNTGRVFYNTDTLNARLGLTYICCW